MKLYVIINIIINEPNRWSDCESTILLYSRSDSLKNSNGQQIRFDNKPNLIRKTHPVFKEPNGSLVQSYLAKP